MRRVVLWWSVLALLGACRGGDRPPQAETSDAEADSALAHALSLQFAVTEVSLTRTAKVVGLSLVDSSLVRLTDGMRRARATTLATWTWHRLAHPAGISRFWIWASPPAPEDHPQAGALYSYWTRDLEEEPPAGSARRVAD